MIPYNFALLFFAFGTFLIGLLIWLKRSDSIGEIYFAFSIFVTLWASFFSIMISPASSNSLTSFCSRAMNVSALLIPPTWLHFTLYYTDDVQKYKKSLKIIYGVALLILLSAPTDLFISGIRPMSNFKYYTQAGPLYHLFTIYFFIVVTLGFVNLFSKLKFLHGSERVRLIGLIIATLAGFIGGGFTFVPVYGFDIPQYNLFLMPIYPFVIAYFMIRQNLFNENELALAAHKDKLAAVGILTTSINHEIRNPLYVIKGLAQSYRQNLDDNLYGDKEVLQQKLREVLNKTAEQADRAMEIMKRFALFAKQQGELNTQRKEASLKSVVENILPLVRHELDLDKIELKINLLEDLPSILVDHRQIEEIIFNLIVNACQAIRNSGQGDKIEINGSVNTPRKVNLTISDTGPGIPKEHLRHIFEPFYTTKETGTGLGLYITKQLVEKNGGTISITSEKGKGTTVTLVFHSV